MMDRSCSDDSGIEEERAGGGPGPTDGGPEQEDRGRIWADDVYPEYWQNNHLSDDCGDTPRANGHCMRCLNVTCVPCGNGKSISPIDQHHR